MIAPTSLLDAIKAIEEATEANLRAESAVRRAVVDLLQVDSVNAELVITHCVRALKHAQHAGDVRGDRRSEIKSAYRMGLAALGKEEVAA